ncbi:MAG: ABC transporter permease [Clostridiales Family XIII bacterium]|nr:ABC transporter permease [Clostridiales Family XIII bacterium]
MKFFKNKTLRFWLISLILPLALLGAWKGADLLGMLKPYTMPKPESVIDTAVELAAAGKLHVHVLSSILLVLKGFLLALAAGLILGVLIGLSKRIEAFFELTVQIFKPIPPIAWIPLAILWLGIEDKSKLYIIFLGALFPILLNVISGIKNIDRKYFELAKVYEVPGMKLIFRVVLPGALPEIMTGIRVGLGNAWVCVVAAEMIASVTGVGYLLTYGRSLSRPDMVILAMLLIGIIGKVMDDGLKFVSKMLTKWNNGEEALVR